MQSSPSTVVILGTGGTIAGTAPDASDNLGYTAAQLGVAELVAGLPAIEQLPVEAEQVSQVDSKDMTHEIWLKLAQRVAHHLARTEVAGVVVTHGTDTLEETAWFLHRVLAPSKPVVLTGAMRPATSSQADGPQNLLDAVGVARHPNAQGVVVVMAGSVHGASDVSKVHAFRPDAFSSGDAGPLARVDGGELHCLRPWPVGVALGLARLGVDAGIWPVVDIVWSHAGARGALVDALCASGAQGVVVVATGNGTVHASLENALSVAQTRGVRVVKAMRCAGGVVSVERDPSALSLVFSALSPAKARIDLMLELLPTASSKIFTD